MRTRQHKLKEVIFIKDVRTSVLLHGIRLNHGQRLLLREEEADLSLGLLVTAAAVQLIDGIVLYSELRS